MKKSFYLIVLLIFCSCGNSLKDLEKEPKAKEIAGNWKLDVPSYPAMLRYSFKCTDVQLTLHEDGSFEAKNFPNVMNEATTEQYADCQNIEGKWSIEKRMTKEKWAILLIADESQAYGKNKSILFDLFLAK